MDATPKFLGLGRGTNSLYICFTQLKGRGHRFLFCVHNATLKEIYNLALINMYHIHRMHATLVAKACNCEFPYPCETCPEYLIAAIFIATSNLGLQGTKS